MSHILYSELWEVDKYGTRVYETNYRNGKTFTEITVIMYKGKEYLHIVVNGVLAYFWNITDY